MKDKNLKELEEQVRSIMNAEGSDFHTRTASSLYGVKCQDVTREQRKNAKAFNFGRLYNISAGDALKILYLEGK